MKSTGEMGSKLRIRLQMSRKRGQRWLGVGASGLRVKRHVEGLGSKPLECGWLLAIEQLVASSSDTEVASLLDQAIKGVNIGRDIVGSLDGGQFSAAC